MIYPMPAHSWGKNPIIENALTSYAITSIYPVKADVALVITNSFGGIKLTQWLIFERFMKREGEHVRTVMSYITQADTFTEALDHARVFGRGVYGVDIADYNTPF